MKDIGETLDRYKSHCNLIIQHYMIHELRSPPRSYLDLASSSGNSDVSSLQGSHTGKEDPSQLA
jgi:hypothetical protein